MLGVKKLERWATGTTKRFDDIFILLDRMTDGRTRGLAKCRAVIITTGLRTGLPLEVPHADDSIWMARSEKVCVRGFCKADHKWYYYSSGFWYCSGVSLDKADKFCYLGYIMWDADGGCDSADTDSQICIEIVLWILTHTEWKWFSLKLTGRVYTLLVWVELSDVW